jgi:hypothetical protein
VVSTPAAAGGGLLLWVWLRAPFSAVDGRRAQPSAIAAFALATEPTELGAAASGVVASGLRRTTAVRNGLFGTDELVTHPASSTAVMESAATRATQAQTRCIFAGIEFVRVMIS